MNITFNKIQEALPDLLNNGLITARPHNNYPNLLVLNYTDKCVFEKKWDEVTLACRGLVIDTLNENIVARPFKKFFNYSEVQEIPNESFVALEKYDGSLIIMFYYDNKWMCATRGSFHSEQAEWANKKIEGLIPNYDSWKQLTFCFEGIYPQNRIVVNYSNLERLVLLGVIDTQSGYESAYDSYHNFWLEFTKLDNLFSIRPAELSVDTVHDVLSYVKTLSYNYEGFVLRFQSNIRIKIKGDEYLRIHKIKSNITPKGVWECLMNGTDIIGMPDEFYQDFKNLADPIKQNFDKIEKRARDIYNQITAHPPRESDDKKNRKEYALRINNACEWNEQYLKSIIFNMLDRKDYTQLIWKVVKPL